MKNNLFTKIIIIIIAFLMLFSVIGQFFVSAKEIDDPQTLSNTNRLINPKVSCDNFEVVTISDNGQINVESCETNFETALNAMNQHPKNGAVRHKNSESPMKFIAATRAILHSVPHRVNGASTMALNDFKGTKMSTYISRGFEMAYFKTQSFVENNGKGRVHLGINGFEGIGNLNQLDIIPMVYVENQIMVELGGINGESSSNLKATRLNGAPAQSYYEIVTKNNAKVIRYVSENLHRAPGLPDKPYFHAEFITLGPADETWMKNGEKYYSWDGVNFYSDRDYKNKVGTYYNYYQYLPLRTKSWHSADVFDTYLNSLKNTSNSRLKNTGQYFVKYGEKYGINPLLTYAMAGLESGWGTSNIAKRNNFFGWAAYDSNPGAATDYDTPEIGIKTQLGKNLRGYLDVTFPSATHVKDSRYHGGHIGNKASGLNVKYASDPFWGLKISQNAYLIDLSNGLKDYKKYSLGLVLDKNEYVIKNTNVTNTNETSGAQKSEVFYNFKSSTGYMGEVATVLGQANSSFYQTQAFAYIDNQNNLINLDSNTDFLDYNWSQSRGYIRANKIRRLHPEVYIPAILPNPNLNVEIFRLGGKNREDTAVLVSKENYSNADNVVLSGFSGDIDALTGTLLAANKNAPLLITQKDKLSESTKAEILRLNAQTVYILGGSNAVSEAVEAEIKALNVNVERIKDANRFGTATKIAETVKETGFDHTFIVLGRELNKGDALADALAVGPAAAKENSPILLVEQNKIPEETLLALDKLNVKRVTIIGGIAAVSQNVENQLKDLGLEVDRIKGTNRENTAIAIAKKYFKDSTKTLVANGWVSADALVGGYFGHKISAPILLTSKNKTGIETSNYLRNNVYSVYVLGGSGVISDLNYDKIFETIIK